MRLRRHLLAFVGPRTSSPASFSPTLTARASSHIFLTVPHPSLLEIIPKNGWRVSDFCSRNGYAARVHHNDPVAEPQSMAKYCWQVSFMAEPKSAVSHLCHSDDSRPVPIWLRQWYCSCFPGTTRVVCLALYSLFDAHLTPCLS